MDSYKKVLALSKVQSALHKEREKTSSISTEFNKPSTIFDENKDDFLEEVEDNDWRLTKSLLSSLSGSHLYVSQYLWAYKKEKALQQDHLSKHANYGYLAIKVQAEIARIREINNLSLGSGEVTFWWTSLLFCQWYKEADEVMSLALESTNDNDLGIMGKGGYSFDTYSFFLLELYCLWKSQSFDRKQYDHPLDDTLDTPFIYEGTLKNWDTTDLELVDKLVSKMADYHISKTEEILPDDKDQDRYYEFSDTNLILYPFEILAWLKIRELSGLKNPEKLSHPLMNLPLAEPITDEELPKPELMSEVEKLLDVVRKHFPDAHI